MTETEFQQFINIRVSAKTVNVLDLRDLSDRTLVYGYDIDRYTYHLYLKDCTFHIVIYKLDDKVSHVESDSLPIVKCIPNKRVYPECCDYEFSVLLLKNSVELPYTHYNNKRDDLKFHGKLNEELKDD
jgi:hypothetical protein